MTGVHFPGRPSHPVRVWPGARRLGLFTGAGGGCPAQPLPSRGAALGPGGKAPASTPSGDSRRVPGISILGTVILIWLTNTFSKAVVIPY